jgi:hypothetical protein
MIDSEPTWSALLVIGVLILIAVGLIAIALSPGFDFAG